MLMWLLSSSYIRNIYIELPLEYSHSICFRLFRRVRVILKTHWQNDTNECWIVRKWMCKGSPKLGNIYLIHLYCGFPTFSRCCRNHVCYVIERETVGIYHAYICVSSYKYFYRKDLNELSKSVFWFHVQVEV